MFIVLSSFTTRVRDPRARGIVSARLDAERVIQGRGCAPCRRILVGAWPSVHPLAATRARGSSAHSGEAQEEQLLAAEAPAAGGRLALSVPPGVVGDRQASTSAMFSLSVCCVTAMSGRPVALNCATRRHPPPRSGEVALGPPVFFMSRASIGLSSQQSMISGMRCSTSIGG